MKKSALIGFLGGIWIAGTALADGGAALVIGNADYAHGPKAVAALADAKAVYVRLDEAGYAVTYGENLDRAEMRAAFATFSQDAENADTLVVFYSGHALRMSGDTYLAPVDIEVTGPVAVAYDGSPLSIVMTILSAKPGAAIAFIDGAQLDGFNPSGAVEPGLGDITAPEGVLIVSAAAPGWAIRRAGEGRSNFGRAIVDDFLKEDQAVSTALRAHKDDFWSDGSAGANLVIAPKQQKAAPVTLPVVVADTSNSETDDIGQQIELAFWKSTESAGTPADYEAYLKRYPNGLFADIARNRLSDAGKVAPKAQAAAVPVATPVHKTTAEKAAVTEASLNLSRAERRSIQADLLVLGHNPNGVDGVFGRGARTAIAQWQRRESLPATGFLTADQVPVLAADANSVRAQRDRDVEREAQLDNDVANSQEDTDWGRAQQINTVAGYRRYMRTYPNGLFLRDARRAIAAIERQEEDDLWHDVERQNTASGYDEYLEIYPNGHYAKTAQRRLQDRFSAVADDEPEIYDEPAAYETAWGRVRSQDSYEAYRDYLKKYPNSPYAKEARNRRDARYEQHLIRVEEKLRMGPKDWLSIEQRLASIGYSVGKINGKPGRGLRRAIKKYRKRVRLPVHSYVDRAFVKQLLRDTDPQ
jgi:peptidoglycan hydrolase-like protein with peptidoglycan-binding domain